MLREQLSRTIEEVQRNATGSFVAHSSDGRTLPTAPSYDHAAARAKAEELADTGQAAPDSPDVPAEGKARRAAMRA